MLNTNKKEAGGLKHLLLFYLFYGFLNVSYPLFTDQQIGVLAPKSALSRI